MDHPWFSILISVYNRPQQIARCVASCLSQTCKDFEIIVVDDASLDNTVEIIHGFEDARIHLFIHEENRGMSAALRTATAHANGQWAVRLDSDHALLPHALQTFYSLTARRLPDIGIFGARYQWDDGRVTPRFVPTEDIDYEGRIRWVEQEGGSDYLSCIRRDVVERVVWPLRRGSTTALFQYSLALQARARILADILALEYTDAENSFHRETRSKKLANRVRNAPDQAQTYDELLSLHGDALQRYGQKQYAFFLIMCGFNHFLAGNRRWGAARTLSFLKLNPLSLVGWGLLVAGSIGSRFLSWTYLFRKSDTI